MENKKKVKIGTIIIVVIVVILVGAIAVWAKGYYDSRYVLDKVYYTQIPSDEVNTDSWLYDSSGKAVQEGKEYYLKGYDENGNERNVSFYVFGKSEDYYPAGTYIRVETSKTIEIGEKIVTESEVPSSALENIKEKGTKLNA